ncbi:MAG: insulinase family protein [Clostridiales bacterium]|nr:insulinase family protein [Clostridiales bacterium]
MKINEIYDAKLDEKIFHIPHPSGLDIFIYPKKDYMKKYAYFTTKYGALYNEFIDESGNEIKLPMGIAHFLEHKIFEDEEGDIFSQFARLGANVNAYTNFASTVYYFSTVNNFESALKILIDFVTTPHINDENVEKEKGIIVQEIKMYDDDPNWRVYFNGLNAMYENHPIREDIAGDEASVRNSFPKDLMKAYDTFYTPDNMTLFLIGDFEFESIKKHVLDILPEAYLNKKGNGKIILKNEKKEVNKALVEMKMGVPIPMFNFFIKGDEASLDEKNFKKSMINRIALDYMFGKSSEFYNINYENGLINGTFGYEYSYGLGYSYFNFGGESNDSDTVSSKILQEIDKFNAEGIQSDSFIRIKRKIIGRYISSFNSIQYISNTFINYYIKGINFLNFLSIVESISEEEVNNAFKFDMENKITLSKVI